MNPDKMQAYFSFTKRERIGIVTLLSAIVAIFLLPYFFPAPKPKPGQQSFEQFRNEIAALKTVPAKDSARYAPRSPPAKKRYDHTGYPHPGKYAVAPKPVLFYFDPNSITAEQWQQLGIPGKTAGTILRYIAKGGRFHEPADLQKIYGLRPADCRQLMPFVKIVPKSVPEHFTRKKEVAFTGIKSRGQPVPIDVNHADTSGWMNLPGIGSRLAGRIVAFRQKLGGFYCVEQVGETFALPDAVFQKIRTFLIMPDSGWVRMDINSADANSLRQHPYIRWTLANAIVAYRKQHGPFRSIAELQQIALVTAEIYKKISPYLQVTGQ